MKVILKKAALADKRATPTADRKARSALRSGYR